ncbi:MAG: 16S rRNA (guanine(527)-N(7))-methyltransferase RsmG [Clostridiales bacterium]|nr:16S rRNA (guanine(527)-N(7))-methyltransferase RsmG [Clostridiales bacterium]
MEYNKNQGILEFKKGLEDLSIILDEHQVKQFLDYYELLINWNKVMNLTSITDFTEVITKHFLDSLSIVKIHYPKSDKILDLGTGAGFPGIPIKIAFPNTQIVLMDSLNKRVNFLNEVIDKLKLDKISAIHGRAEDLGKDPSYRDGFDICTSRAVARLSVLSEYCIPFLKKGGYFISYKSGKITEELDEAKRAIEILGGTIKKTSEFQLSGTDMGRSLILIEKVKNTPKRYPRMAGKPTKEPL